MYRLLRFIILGVWTMPEPAPIQPEHQHNWKTLTVGADGWGPIITLQCRDCGDCKIVKR